MKLRAALIEKLGNIRLAVARYPAVLILLLAMTVLNAVAIQTGEDFHRLLMVLIFGVFCFAAAQALDEKLRRGAVGRLLCMLGAAAVSGGYLIVILVCKNDEVDTVRTLILCFAALFAFLWISSFRSEIGFDGVFLSFFKSFFTSAFFSAVIWGGVSLILAAVDRLLFHLDYKLYGQVANVVWVAWAPMLLLSLMPDFSSENEERDPVERSAYCPKFLDVLISFVLIPLTMVYTLVLLIYIVKTIATGAWGDNLLEPLTLTYCAAVLLLCFLTGRLRNRVASVFLAVLPKILIPIAIFQIVVSAITVSHVGMIHTRYLVLLFCLYSAVAGALISIFPVRRHGVVAIVAVAFAVVCVMPPVDLFTVSRSSQYAVLVKTLENDGMLENGRLVPRADAPAKDRTTIVRTVEYLSEIGELGHIRFLPTNFNVSNDFQTAFGFSPYGVNSAPGVAASYFDLTCSDAVSVKDYDVLTGFSVSSSSQEGSKQICSVLLNGKSCALTFTNGSEAAVSVVDASGKALLTVPIEPLVNQIAKNSAGEKRALLPGSLMQRDERAGNVSMRIVFQNITGSSSAEGLSYNAAVWILLSSGDTAASAG